MELDEDAIGSIVVDTAVNLHRNIGCGLFENVNEVILTKLLSKRGLSVQRQVAIPVEKDKITNNYLAGLAFLGALARTLSSTCQVNTQLFLFSYRLRSLCEKSFRYYL